jgi:hypothetical protein
MQVLAPLFEPSRVAHRTGLVPAVGGWRSGPGLEDWDLWVRLADAGHRLQAVAEVTAEITEQTGTRRHRVARPHTMRLARFDRPRDAAAAMRALRSLDHDPQANAAGIADAVDWIRRLQSSPDYREPLGANGFGDLAGAVADAVAGRSAGWTQDLALAPGGGGTELVASLWCANDALAGRVDRTARAVQRRQLELVASVAASCGGVPLAA